MKFELKLNNVRFVGHPTLIPSSRGKEVNSSMLFNVVFALQAQANQSVVKCYHDLSKRSFFNSFELLINNKTIILNYTIIYTL